MTLQWRHNERDGVSNNQPNDCLLIRLFRRRSKKTSKNRTTGPLRGIQRWPVNSPHKGTVTRKMFPFCHHFVIMRRKSVNLSQHLFLISLGLYDTLLFVWSHWRVFIWWRHQMEIYEFPSQRPVTQSFDVFFDLSLNKRLSKQSGAGNLRRHRAHYDVTVRFPTARILKWCNVIMSQLSVTETSKNSSLATPALWLNKNISTFNLAVSIFERHENLNPSLGLSPARTRWY